MAQQAADKKRKTHIIMPFGIPAPERGHAPGLTLRILAVNVIAPLLLVLGLLYLGKYQESLIRAEMETLESQARLFAAAVSEAPIYDEKHEHMAPDRALHMVQKLGNSIDHRVMLFDEKGMLLGATISPEEYQIRLAQQKMSDLALITRSVGYNLLALLPGHTPLHSYPGHKGSDVSLYPAAILAMDGKTVSLPWEASNHYVITTAAAPIIQSGKVLGAIHITRSGFEIEQAMAQVRFDVFTAFLGALSLTIFMSIYLAGIIGRPLRKLAVAAEDVRRGKRREVVIPDMSHRNDEIGDLSLALREMTQALWDRMDTIERFAADVAHEIKNPLTSLRSAVETAGKITSEKDRQRLMEVIYNDVQRLDWLMSDISHASRLDAELSRDKISTVDVCELLQKILHSRQEPLERASVKDKTAKLFELDTSGVHRDALVKGNETRLAQVFDNLLTNAQSFSPNGGVVRVMIDTTEKHVAVYIEDEGPGIPENKLETIFERFYTERPAAEGKAGEFGTHSGLGLSISKQIVTALGGRIFAENRYDSDNRIIGARFAVFLDHA